MDEAEGLSEADLALVEQVVGHHLVPFVARGYQGWHPHQLKALLDAARAESRSTPDREELKDWCGRTFEVAERVKAELGSPNCQAIQTQEDRARLVAYRYGYQVGIAEAAKDVQAILARPASSAGGVEEATRLLAKALAITDPLDPQLDMGGKLIACRDLARTALATLTSKGADRG